jgi:hypothetical protein
MSGIDVAKIQIDRITPRARNSSTRDDVIAALVL